MERKEPTHSEDPMHGASSSSTSPHLDDYESGTKTPKINDYEVFLSFREEDTGKGFTDHLYTNLVDAGIHVFRYDGELRVGDEEISPELLCFITQSKISIPIISENYASSKLCLRELTQMLKYKKSRGQIVLPIFYKMEALQLQHLTGRWRDAIKARVNEMIVNEWEEALKEVGSMRGWESEKINNGREGALVKIVVGHVVSHLKRNFQLYVPKQLVGIDDHVIQIISQIDGKFNDTRIIGIYGMGGIGKTTLAKVLYNKLLSRFEHHSFVANIRETSWRKGIECIQNQLIFDIIGRSSHVVNVDEGIGVLKSRSTSKKVLILLDDVDDRTQLNALVGDNNWFKAGSVIIITTRNKIILDEVRVSHMYQLNELSLDQSLKLFSRHAFRKDSPLSEYKVISRDIISTIEGLPLALEVIGSFLCGKRKEIWKATLKKLWKVPDAKVQECLRRSYDALDYREQQMFLDIACFFVGSSHQSPTYMWDACDFFPREGIEKLSHMSLIKIDKDGNLMMHNQLRDFGRQIVHLENLNKPGKRSRLWIQEAVDVLDNNEGTGRIEALRLDKAGQGKRYTDEQFKKLTNLRFLQVRGANLAGDFENLLPKLKWLRWEDCPSSFAMANLHPKDLVVLELSGNEILEDWEGWGVLKMATKLKVLNLSHCRSLIRTPDLFTFKSLEMLILANCWNLKELHPSIEDIKTLVSLNVTRCSKLEKLPVGIGRMEELKELILDEAAIQEIPISRGCLSKLETLRASYCEFTQLPEFTGSLVSLTRLDLSHSWIKELPESISLLVSLTELDLSHSWIEDLPESMGSLVSLTKLNLSHSRIEDLPESMGSLVSLTQLDLSHSWIEDLLESMGLPVSLTQLDLSHSRIEELPESMCSLTLLTQLHLSHLGIEELPKFVGSFVSLTQLDLSHLGIEELPESIRFLKELKTLDASNCEALAHIPNSIGHLALLQCLLLRECHSLREIPDSIGKLASLIKLDLKSTMIVEFPETIGGLKKLDILDSSYCTLLAHIPDSMGHLASLSLLDLRFCRNLAKLPNTIGSLVSLQRLLLQECRLLREIPGSIGELASLIELDLKHTAIAELPESIGSLKELETLNVSYCALLVRIPSSIGNLASLSLLDLRFCRKLAQLPNSIGSLISLQRLLLRECCSLREIPNSIGKLASLIELDLKRTAIVELPKSIGNLQKLRISNDRGTHLEELPGVIRMLQIAKI